MNDDTPDWRDDRQTGEESPRQPGGSDRRANDPRFTDTRPPSYGQSLLRCARILVRRRRASV